MIISLRNHKFAAALAGILALGPVGAQAQTLTTTALSPSERENDPYKWTGIVLAYERGSASSLWRGSGSVARHPKIVVSCAHVIHNDGAWFTGDYRWFWKWPNSTTPAASQGRLMRGEIRWAAYHQEVRNDIAAGVPSSFSSPGAFDFDITAFWSFEDTAGGGFAGWWSDGRLAMKSSESKKISGYPWRPFGSNTFAMFRTGPFTDRFAELSKRGGGVTTRYMRPGSRDTVPLAGNSGGPLWVREGNGGWGQAGVFVSGGVGTTALDAAAWGVIAQAITNAGGTPPPPSDDHPNTPDNATTITPGVARGGVLETGGDIDFFQFTVSETADYVLQTTGSTDTFGALLNDNRSVIAEDNDSGTGTNFRISRRLGAGRYYVRVSGSNASTTGPYTLLVTASAITVPSMNVAGLSNRPIPSGSTSPEAANGTHFGNVILNQSLTRTFTVGNTGNAVLSLSGNPRVSITGPGAARFTVSTLPATTVAAGASSQFIITFRPTTQGPQRATVSISNTDPGKNPYTFAIEGVGDDHTDTLQDATVVIPGVPRAGTLDAGGDVDFFQFTVPQTADYVIQTEGSTDTYGSLLDANSFVLAEDNNSGTGTNFRISRRLGAGRYYVRVRGASNLITGSYNLSVIQLAVTAPNMNITGLSNRPVQNGNVTPEAGNGTHFGSVNTNQSVPRTFAVTNTGNAVLSLSGNPRVSITGSGAAHFRVSTLPATTVAAGASSQFIITFSPTSQGSHRALVTIANNDVSKNPYTFAVEGSGIAGTRDDHGNSFDAATALGAARTRAGTLDYGGDEDYFSFSVAQTRLFTIETKGATDTYGFLYSGARALLGLDNDSGENLNFRIVRELTPGTYFIRVRGFGNQTTGGYTLEITENRIEPEINITTPDLTPIPHASTVPSAEAGTDFGSVLHASGQVERTYRVENLGFANLLLTGTPRVALSGAGASHFQVVAQPAAAITRGGFTTFRIRYRPATPGTHTATVEIPNTDSDENPYRFVIRGVGSGAADDHGNTPATATPLGFPAQAAGALERGGDVDVFRFEVPQARTVTVETTGNTDTFGHLLDSAGRQLDQDDNGGTDRNFRIIRLLQPGTYYIRVRGASNTVIGSYLVRLVSGPLAPTGLRVLDRAGRHVAAGSQVTPGTDFGSVAAINAVRDLAFTLQNRGEGAVQLTSPTAVTISGEDAAAFVVIREPATLIAARNGATPLNIRFDPRRVGVHSARVEIRSNDATAPDYLFDIKGTGTGVMIPTDDHGDDRLTASRALVNNDVEGRIGHVGDQDWFSFVIPRESMVTLFTTGSTDTFGHLHNAAGGQLAFDNDGGSTQNFRIVRRLPAGTYYVRVRGFSAATTGAYSLRVEARDALPAITMQNPVTDFGPVVSGRGGSRALQFRMANTGEGALVLEGTQRVTVTGPGAVHFAVIAQPAGLVQPGAATHFTVRFTPAEVGEHAATVNIWSNNPQNPFTFAIRGTGLGGGGGVGDDHGNTPATATQLPLGQTGLPGVLERGGDIDYFRISVPSGGRLTVESSGVTDTFGDLYDSNGQLIASDDDSAGTGLNFKIVRRVNAGTYFLRVTGFSSTTTGAYRVSAKLDVAPPDDHGDIFSTATRIEMPLPRQIEGELTEGDVDMFRFDLPVRASIRTYTTNTDDFTDTFGELYNANGTLLASDDDSGGGLNFQIIRYGLPAGTYYIRVRGYQPTSTGRYILHLEEP
jgi:hypothetical protein